jgi:hypothetical protein
MIPSAISYRPFSTATSGFPRIFGQHCCRTLMTEEANGLNQQADAEQRAEAILEKSTVLMRELTTWMSYIGKGLQAAFGGSALFKWAGEAFDKVSSKFLDRLPSVNKLKGLSSICVVSHFSHTMPGDQADIYMSL